MIISQKRPNYILQLIFLLLACKSRITLSSSEASSSLSCVPSLDDGKERIDYIQRSLCDRFNYVNTGRRASDFRRWINSRGGQPKIFSMHGVDVNFEIDELKNVEVELDVYPLSKLNNDDPFMPDRMNLNFHHELSTSPTIYYKGDVTEHQEKAPTAFQLYVRAIKLSFYFGPVMSTAWLAALSKKFRCGIWYNMLARSLASSGAAFIKWGQWAATRSDMFPTQLCDALSTLHSAAPSHSWNFTQTQVESSLDIPKGSLFEVFESFDPEPLASGSIAQVHKARLRNGEVVAAKVRHPKVARLIDMDFRLMAMLSTVFDWIPAFKWFHVKDSLSQFSHTMAAQAHLNVEAHNLEVLNHNFRSTAHVGFPRPIFASSCLILETFEKGSIVTDVLEHFENKAQEMENALQGFELIPMNLAHFLVSTGVSMYLKMLLVDNIMHADLHPGNIMIDIVNSAEAEDLSSAKFKVTLVDAGMVAQLTDEESSAFVGLMTSLGAGDGNAAAEFALRFSIENNMDVKQKEKFKQDMCKLFAKKCLGYGNDVDVGNILRGVLGLIREHHVRIDPNFATLVINALCVESLARRVCPSYNVLDAARPLLETYRNMCYEEDGFTPKSKETYHKRIKRIMPMLLNGKKRSEDRAFFKKFAIQRRQGSKAAC